ncbi:MAG TPA: hypothetical protein PLB36_04605 [Bacillota bacterium]|nr:hypothetical protein [Candidatus Fermentithermobacillaceae bacterium]HOB30841.1 hypothetical protein [Bacillota bacterium]HOK64592.1 hypothetical protein [Bacillota bacterium]HOL12155.1 hypothetical protein [Bacillota bacterium]HOQ03269.1 hypothetical protein [Bacillota bacterium]
MWTVVYVASGWEEAEMMKSRLAKEGLLVMLRTYTSGDSKSASYVEVLVPRLEAREAHSIIMQDIGTSRA